MARYSLSMRMERHGWSGSEEVWSVTDNYGRRAVMEFGPTRYPDPRARYELAQFWCERLNAAYEAQPEPDPPPVPARGGADAEALRDAIVPVFAAWERERQACGSAVQPCACPKVATVLNSEWMTRIGALLAASAGDGEVPSGTGPQHAVPERQRGETP